MFPPDDTETCSGNGTDAELQLNEVDVQLSLEGFSSNDTGASISFHDLLISFKADLEFEVKSTVTRCETCEFYHLHLFGVVLSSF